MYLISYFSGYNTLADIKLLFYMAYLIFMRHDRKRFFHIVKVSIDYLTTVFFTLSANTQINSLQTQNL